MARFNSFVNGFEEIGLWPHLLETITEAARRISMLIADSGYEPLDGDETERLGRLLDLELNLSQGNITPDEYEEALEKEVV